MGKKSKYTKVVADFETTCHEGETTTRVWSWCIADIASSEVVATGTNINTFMDYITNNEKSLEIYFHNAKFDTSFLIDYLLKNNYKCVEYKGNTTKLKKNNDFCCYIDGVGVFYLLKMCNKTGGNIIFKDSYKILPQSAASLAKSFNLEEQKGSIEYTKYRPIGYEPTSEEWDYIKNDCIIIAKILKSFFEQGYTKSTIASNALNTFKKFIGRDTYKELFPRLPLWIDDYIRNSYRGGLCAVNPKNQNKLFKDVNYFYYDVNSMYPSILKDCLLPYGTPIFFDGEYKEDIEHPLYIQRVKVSCFIKKNKVPSILLKNCIGSVYLEECNDTTLTLTNIDLQRLLNDYDIIDIIYIDGFKFKARKGMFDAYIDHFYALKKQADASGDGALRTICKLFLNALYGKFGQNPRGRKKTPYIENNLVKYKTSDIEVNTDTIKYTAVASFCTSYAREKLLCTIDMIGYDNWIYSDTDSIISKVPFNADIVGKELGQWDLEKSIKHIKVLGQKSYMLETHDDKRSTALAGCNKDALQKISLEDFNIGYKVKDGNRRMKKVVGGMMLEVKEFEIKPKNIKLFR